MSNCFDFELEDLVYEEYSDEDILDFEEIGYSFFKGINEVKKKVANAIKGENVREIKKYVYEELEIGENILSEFNGYMDGTQYLDMMYSAEVAFIPMVCADVGLRYYCFITDRKLLMYEVGYLNKIMREYIVDNKNIDRVTVDEKDNHLSFYVKKDKYNMTRTTISCIFYYMFQGRVGMHITSENKDEIYKLFRENYKQEKFRKLKWILSIIIMIIIVLLI